MGFNLNEARAQRNPDLGLGSSGSFLCGARVRGPHYDEHNPPNDPKRQRALKGGGQRRWFEIGYEARYNKPKRGDEHTQQVALRADWECMPGEDGLRVASMDNKSHDFLISE